MNPATAEAPTTVAWRPHPGSQALFLSCPIYECLYTGTRGPGKTDSLLMDFAQHVGRGYGEDWRGVLFRQSFPQLRDVIAKSRKWFHRIFPEASYNKSDHVWTWPDGEQLVLAYMDDPSDYWNYHGHEYPWIGWEEITNWPTGECYHVMKACNRSSSPDVPRKYRATCNPYGAGHNWVKAYFIDPAPAGVPFMPPASIAGDVLAEIGVEMTGDGLRAVTLHGHYSENTTLMRAQPNYAQFIAQAASNPEQAKAWLADDWDIVAGGMFDDLWSRATHVLSGDHAWSPAQTPPSWRVDRSFDWGSSKPFSVGWWAESDGTQAPNGRIYPRGTLIRVGEWYGWDGKTPNQGIRATDSQIARGIKEREKQMGIHGRCKHGPADAQIFTADPGKKSTAAALAAEGIRFTESNKKPGSRVAGWRRMRDMLAAAKEGDRERPHLYVLEDCRQFIRTIPALPRDDRNPDDVDTDAEDHIADETRYRLLSAAPRTVTSTMGVL